MFNFERMVFEVGKYYQHIYTHRTIKILCETDAYFPKYGVNVLLAESPDGIIMPIGKTESATIGWHEITEKYYLEGITQEELDNLMGASATLENKCEKGE